MATLFFAVVLLVVIVYAVSTAAKKARARAARTFVQVAQSGAFGTADAAPNVTRTVVRDGNTMTVTVRTSATMADGSPLTPFAQQTLNNLTAHNDGSLLDTAQMAALRQAMQSNGMGQLGDIIERQLRQAGIEGETTAPGAVPAQDPAPWSAQMLQAQPQAVPEPFAQPPALTPVAERPSATPMQPAASTDPFASTQNPFHAGDAFSSPPRDADAGNTDPFRRDKPLF